MASEAKEPSPVSMAEPTVRLKGKENYYGRTMEFDIFMSKVGKSEDLVDEERWLDYPVDDPLENWTKLDIAVAGRLCWGQSTRPEATMAPTTKESTGQEDRPIWDPMFENDEASDKSKRKIVRVPTEEHLSFRLFARACKAEKVKNEEMRDYLGTSLTNPLMTDSKIRGVYVGISAIDCVPILMLMSFPKDPNTPWTGDALRRKIKTSLVTDTLEFVTLRGRDGSYPGAEIIWLENMLIPGNISFVKRGIWGQLPDDEKLNEITKRKPSISRPIHDGKNYDTLHYRLRWPPMAVLEFPQQMIEWMEKFLSWYPSDNVSLNIALAATVIYFDLEKGNHQAEGFLDGSSDRLPYFRGAWLKKFIIYFPHMLRDDCSELDIPWQPKVDDEVRSWYSAISSRHPQVPSSTRFTLVPSSMPGTNMVFPQDCTNVEKPSSDLFKTCCLDDVRTLGLPSYHYRGVQRGYSREVGSPSWMFSKAVQNPKSRLQSVPSVDYWKTEPTGGIKALTGTARRISTVFPDIGSSCYGYHVIKPVVDGRFGVVRSYLQNFQLCDDLQDAERKIIAKRANDLNRIADRLGIPSEKRRMSFKTLCPEWDGMEVDLRSLLMEGKLKRYAAGEPPLPPAKRAKPVDPALSPEVQNRIAEIIDSLKTSSDDWKGLQKLIESPAPKLKAVQESFSPVRSFVADVQKALQPENSENGQGSIDQVIRVAFRAEGLYTKAEVEALDYRSKWEKHRLNRFIKIGQALGDCMQVIFSNCDEPGGFRLTLPNIQVLRESPLVKDQVEAYKKIEALLSPPRTVIKLKTSKGDPAKE
ncbi:hypothetical protein FVEG_03703 [Fusarium verticillioides 7600]|uniref:Uncharacterized protein n=1 Tax=Gibberella moniliformis (strain M3125 / FGSC 7600) TaxID=334819 RepID=W7M293_GIBM7|nr:hypothetical protein FVEG_03703 [Fusarium verticillioides 7600]EWG41629.1 hypothetical protein FVEG_03703 [Fusarium verticillioides 7600]